MLTILIILLLVLLLAGAVPAYPYNRSWGYGPVGVIVLVLVIWLLWRLLGGG